MNYPLVINLIGKVLVILSAFMILPLLISISYRGNDMASFLISVIITSLTGIILHQSTKKQAQEELRHREGFAIVTFSWLAISFFGALPYLFSGTFSTLTDAFFESISGFTTTGASVLTDIEVQPKGILFWRSLTQWIGGMGIIVFSLAILPFLGTGGMQLFKAEVPEITVDKLRPRIIDTAKALWIIYTALTLTAFVFLLFGKMTVFDACCHALTTLATGGFSTKNASIGHYNSPYIDTVITIFMILAGINYSLYYLALQRRYMRFISNSEFQFYILTIALSIVMITLTLYSLGDFTFAQSLDDAAFQVASIITTTGYATANYENWPFFAQAILLMLMLFGGMIGSTAGGMKQVRVLLMLKQGLREICQQIHPRAIITIKLDNKNVSSEIRGSIWGFLFLFVSVCVTATLAMTALGLDLITSATTIISALSNVGPALGEAGPAENYSKIPALGKWILSLCMLIGRLEVYTVIVLFTPHFWKS